MQKKWFFLHARFLVLLMLAGVGFGLAGPEVADAQTAPAIEWIKIYHIPESALRAVGPTSTGVRPAVSGVWPPSNFIQASRYAEPGTNLEKTRTQGIINGYVPIGSNGEPVGGIPATPDMTLGEGQILAIAVRVGPVNQIHWGMRLDMSWTKGGLLDETYLSHWFYSTHLVGITELSKFTALYCYKVRAGDLDLDGGWFGNNTPFRGVSGSNRPISNSQTSVNVHTLTFAQDTVEKTIVYPQIESIRPLLSYPTFDPPFSGWDQPYRINGNLNPLFNLPAGSRWVQDGNSPYTITSTPQGRDPESRFAAFYETCFYVWHNAGRPGTSTSQFRRLLENAGCITGTGDIAYPENLAPRDLGIYGVGETIRFQIKFSEPVYANPETRLKIKLHSGNDDAEYATLVGTPQPVSFGVVPGSSGTRMAVRSDADNNLTFEYVVREGDWAYGTGGIEIFHPFASLNRLLPDGTVDSRAFVPSNIQQWNVVHEITDAGGNPFDGHAVTTKFRGRQPPENWSGGFSHMIDTIRANVQIERAAGETGTVTGPFDVDMHFWNKPPTSARGVPEHVASIDTDAIAEALGEGWSVETELLGFNYKNIPGDSLHHTFQSEVHRATFTPPLNLRGDVEIQLPENVAQDLARNGNKASNAFTVSVVTPPTVQVARRDGGTGLVIEDFAVDFTFGRDVISPFDAEKIRITQADGTALAWDVAVTQPTSPSATVSAVVTPAFHFDGKVHITLDAGAVNEAAAVDDTVAVPEYLSNAAATEALVVDVDTVPPRVTETPKIVDPEEEVYTVGNELTVEISFDEEGVTYEGDNPPYVVIYLGERTVANARHATWQKGSERGGSTIVPFAYPIQVGDFATSLSLDTSGVLIPQGTRVVDGDGNELSGQATPAIAPGEPVAQLPPRTTREDTIPFPTTQQQEPPTFDLTDSPVSAVIYLPETSDPKSSASDVPRSPVVFNELGNGSGDTEDWLELRNVTGSDVSLKDWELSVVADGKKEETSLIMFPDVSVPANGLLLITNSAPDKTPLAGGENRGLSHASLVDAGLSLPDDGKFLLILRNAKEKLGMNEAFIDVAGGGGSDTDAFIREQEGLYDTHVWPLQVLQSPGGDTEDALSSGKVWQRAKADIVGYHKDAWAEAAFTGIGYDRKVSESAATAGTPGYPNGAVKTAAATPRGAVTFSEIMLDSSGGTLPQWIELYNHSKTEALNLNRWQLELQNEKSADLIGRPIVTLTLQEKVIQPNQTLLIVAGAARASSADVFPEDRVYNLLKLHEKNLRIKTARDTFLSTEGFYLKLTDRNGNLVDEVGNTDGHRRTDDAPSWAVPLSGLEDSRSSLVRRYKDGVAESGTRRAGWASAARFKQFKVESLHYGHADDIGTPGYRQGGALPVELSSFTVTRTDAGAVVVTWTTESEVDNAGFNLRRSLKRDSGFTLLNPVLIAGAGTTGERQVYTFTDTSAKPGVEYYYQIEEVSLGGQRAALALRMLRGPVSASNRMLTTFGEVKRRE